MKQLLFNILPKKIRSLKYADKIAHLIYGTIIYLLLSFISKDVALFSIFTTALLIEFVDKLRYNKADILDFLATITIPVILYFI